MRDSEKSINQFISRADVGGQENEFIVSEAYASPEDLSRNNSQVNINKLKDT